MSLRLDMIRRCLEGAVPGTVATADADGMPNVSYLSQVQYVDAEHLALSYQFFNKTRQNLQLHPYATLVVIDPLTAAQYRMTLHYLRTETAGPLFESMKAKLAGIASHVGMGEVFRLLGADVFRVLSLEAVPGSVLAAGAPRQNLFTALRASCERLRRQGDLDALLTEVMGCLDAEFGIRHAMALLYDDLGERLYTVASRGYTESGIGSEIALGQGVIGVAARERTPIRISHMTAAYGYSRAIRAHTEGSPISGALDGEIGLPGLPAPGSQLAVPLLAGEQLLGVLYVESPHELRFGYDEEDALVALASVLAVAIRATEAREEDSADTPVPTPAPPAETGDVLLVRHFSPTDVVFLGDEYLIKGVAGAILATMVSDFVEKGRTDFTNRELRLDPRIRLPELGDNLEGRLLLLTRRLAERHAGIHLERTGRGRLKLCVARPLQFVRAADAP
ncbi:GAF domain-containing protein [Massilia sp. TS11]|uniref:GAF domain-containing protein n=1 Tax=Massilia sp. TS11 TaxID=2908003 RepID=UPI001EDB06EF|nr:GAF domain-containing protein [Massilia sp. TS11]MCG2583451.1 GAF domain-containing protein [Massilia sp. TS11]